MTSCKNISFLNSNQKRQVFGREIRLKNLAFLNLLFGCTMQKSQIQQRKKERKKERKEGGKEGRKKERKKERKKKDRKKERK